ncbi:SEC-C metal-binding domain-containing protein [Desulforudis sp. DRI-14]|uniref:SEC-C metal-binding domain-containing protein n=1 Tax=Desulforudis sp. DRI-14 TaxID=3459793 RepID=UPI004042C76D
MKAREESCEGVRAIITPTERCPCGSDKPYAECCGIEDKVVSLAQVRWRRTASQLRRKLSDFAEEFMFARDASRAQDIYFQQIEDDIWALDEDFIIERCFEWFIFDYRLSGEQTLLELYRDANLENLTLTEALLLVLWSEAKSRFYEVTALLPGKGLVVRDIFENQSFWVREPGLQPEAEVGQIIFVRLLRVGAEYEFSTSAIGIAPSMKEIVQEWVNRDFRRWRRIRRRQEDNQFSLYLQQQAHRLSSQAIRFSMHDQASLPWRSDGGDHPVKRLMTLLQGDILNRICRTEEGREQVEVLLQLIQDTDDKPGADSRTKTREKRASAENTVAGYNWPNQGYAGVAVQVEEGLKELGYLREEIQIALRLWYHFCVQEHPVLRKRGAWTAAVIYTMSRLDGRRHISQNELARRYRVAVSSVSNNFNSLSRALKIFPERGKDSDHGGIDRCRVHPLLDRIIASLKL